MKSKALIAIAVAGLFSTAAIADKSVFYSEASEENPIRDTLDMKTGGFKGWGPIANPVSAAADHESTVQRDQDLMKDRQQHLADVYQARERVWIANAPLRDASPYSETAIGSTGGVGSGVLHFFQKSDSAKQY